jgi:hypothetical protein
MARDIEPTNNLSTTPDAGGRPSASNSDGSSRINFAFHAVQSDVSQISGGKFPASASDAADYIALSLKLMSDW